MMLKPFKGSEALYKKFLKQFMTTMVILVKGTQALLEMFQYLTTNSEPSIADYDFKNLGKVLFNGIIYNNPLVQECLNEIDRELPGQPIILCSSYESLSEGETPQKPELEYNSIKVHNYMRLNDGEKSEFILFILKTKAVKFKDIEITNRRPFTSKDFRDLMINPQADLYGVKFPEPKQQSQSYRHFVRLFRYKTENKPILKGWKRFRSDSYSSSDNLSDQDFPHEIFESDIPTSLIDDKYGLDDDHTKEPIPCKNQPTKIEEINNGFEELLREEEKKNLEEKMMQEEQKKRQEKGKKKKKKKRNKRKNKNKKDDTQSPKKPPT